MVWEGISHSVKSPLIVVPGNPTAVRYRDEILRPVAVQLVQQHQMSFQHDNARFNCLLIIDQKVMKF